jgi:hypothetical protein
VAAAQALGAPAVSDGLEASGRDSALNRSLLQQVARAAVARQMVLQAFQTAALSLSMQSTQSAGQTPQTGPGALAEASARRTAQV